MEAWNIPAPVARCCQTLRRAGFAAYPVGGCVRDLLLGRSPGDWDLTTAARPDRVVELFEKTVPTGLPHGTVTVLLEGMAIEVTSFRRESGYADGRHPDAVCFDAGLGEDLARRDFTVNALALAPDGGIIDLFGGRTDLERKCLRCVGDPQLRLREDALRMLRALRFAAQLGFAIEAETLAAIAENAPLAQKLSPQRVTAELHKTLLSPRPELALQMAALGLLCPWVPAAEFKADFPPKPEEGPRWRAFCTATGLSLSALPVTRALRRAAFPPLRDTVAHLALSGGALYDLGLRGGEIGAAQKKLAEYVKIHPEENETGRLKQLL